MLSVDWHRSKRYIYFGFDQQHKNWDKKKEIHCKWLAVSNYDGNWNGVPDENERASEIYEKLRDKL